MKNGLEFFFISIEPLLRYLLTCLANSVFLGKFFSLAYCLQPIFWAVVQGQESKIGDILALEYNGVPASECDNAPLSYVHDIQRALY